MRQEKPEYYYQQSAVIPYRWRDDQEHESQPADKGRQLEILLITSRKRKRWIIPKGIIEPHLTPAGSALQEAWEEAGIEGQVSKNSIGVYRYPKWSGVCIVTVFVMAVTQQYDTWLEDFRDREWVSLEIAAQRVDEAELKQIIRSLPEFLENEETLS